MVPDAVPCLPSADASHCLERFDVRDTTSAYSGDLPLS